MDDDIFGAIGGFILGLILIAALISVAILILAWALPIVGDFFLCRYLWRRIRRNTFTSKGKLVLSSLATGVFLSVVFFTPFSVGGLFAFPISLSMVLIAIEVWRGVKMNQMIKDIKKEKINLVSEKSLIEEEICQIEKKITKNERIIKKKRRRKKGEQREIKQLREKLDIWMREDPVNRKVLIDGISEMDFSQLDEERKEVYLQHKRLCELKKIFSPGEIEKLERDNKNLEAEKEALERKLEEMENLLNAQKQMFSDIKNQPVVI